MTTALAPRRVATLLSIALSLGLLYALYQAIDVRALVRVMRQADLTWMIVSLSGAVPITIARAWRFTWLLPAKASQGLMDAIALTIVSSAVNTLLPAKAGDFTKSVVIARRGAVATAYAIAVVVYERLCDLLGLLAWCVGCFVFFPPDTPLPSFLWWGLAISGGACGTLVLSERASLFIAAFARALLPGRFELASRMADAWPELVRDLRGLRGKLALFSVGIWFMQLVQIWLFTVAVDAEVSFGISASLSAIALLIALVPITFGGIGVRDVALVVLLAPYMSAEQAAAVAVLTTLRGLLMPIAALPLLRSYVVAVTESRKAAASESEVSRR